MSRLTHHPMRAFTLVELLAVIAALGMLIAILLPTLNAARGMAHGATCKGYLRAFGNSLDVYAFNDRYDYRCSGAFDHRRDGDVRKFGWVADAIALKIAVPGKMLCPQNPYRVNEKVADYTGAAATAVDNPLRWADNGGSALVPIIDTSIDAEHRAQAQEMWAQGYNTNYATTWHLVRGDPTAEDGYDVDGSALDPSKCPRDGDGPLSDFHLSGTSAPMDRVPLMGDARAGAAADSAVDSAYADTINDFAGEQVIRPGEFTVESFTDGMTIDYSGVLDLDPETQFGHDFIDIAPLHSGQEHGLVGGYANVLFADGHAESVHDRGGQLGYYGNPVSPVDDVPDGFLGPFKTAGGFEINASAFAEISEQMWFSRLRPRRLPGGGSIE